MVTINTLTGYNVRHTTFYTAFVFWGDLLVEVSFPLRLIEHQIMRVKGVMESQLHLFLPNVSIA